MIDPPLKKEGFFLTNKFGFLRGISYINDMKENKEVANMNIKELRTYAKEQYELSGNGKPWMSNKMDKAYNEFSKAKRLIKAFEATHSVEAEVEIYKTLRA